MVTHQRASNKFNWNKHQKHQFMLTLRLIWSYLVRLLTDLNIAPYEYLRHCGASDDDTSATRYQTKKRLTTDAVFTKQHRGSLEPPRKSVEGYWHNCVLHFLPSHQPAHKYVANKLCQQCVMVAITVYTTLLTLTTMVIMEPGHPMMSPHSV